QAPPARCANDSGQRHTCTQDRALRHPGPRVAPRPEPIQLPEALTVCCANTPARRARDRSYPEIHVSSFQGNHNKSPPCL
ncbi:hypothetical protein A2U01_0090515, partial [Trifolium medium]|nr:hypothetical protein [Trifolium medium]